MGNRAAKEEVKKRNPDALNLVEFRKRIQAGDLILIGTRKAIESDISLPPQLLHCLKFTIKEKFSITRKISLPVWDCAAIVVDMSMEQNAGKSLLELTPDGFVVSEFISRMMEIKKKGFDICVRFLQGPYNNSFKENLITLGDYLAGKSLDELEGTPIYDEVRRPVDVYLNDINRDSNLKNQLKEAFDMIATESEVPTISRLSLHDLMREFTGTNMDLTVDELAEELQIEDDVAFEEFYEKWANGPGRMILSEEIYEQAHLVGQFLKHIYKVLGVTQEVTLSVSTPDDFATHFDDLNSLRNPNIELLSGYTFTVQVPVKL